MNLSRSLIIVIILLTITAQSTPAQDLFNAEILPDGSLLVQHLNSHFNCCSLVGNEVDVVDFTLIIRETEPYHGLCWCTCFFNIEVIISDLPAGTYSIEYTYDANEHPSGEDWLTEIFSVVIPDLGVPPYGPDFVSNQSDCHDDISVSTQAIGFEHIKAIYR